MPIPTSITLAGVLQKPSAINIAARKFKEIFVGRRKTKRVEMKRKEPRERFEDVVVKA